MLLTRHGTASCAPGLPVLSRPFPFFPAVVSTVSQDSDEAMQHCLCSPAALTTCPAGSVNPCLSQEWRSPPGRGLEGDCSSSSGEVPNRATYGASWCKFMNKLQQIKKDVSRRCPSFDVSKSIQHKMTIKMQNPDLFHSVTATG